MPCDRELRYEDFFHDPKDIVESGGDVEYRIPARSADGRSSIDTIIRDKFGDNVADYVNDAIDHGGARIYEDSNVRVDVKPTTHPRSGELAIEIRIGKEF